MRRRIDDAISTGETVVDTYRFDSLRLSSVIRSAGQAGLSLGVDARGTLEEITSDTNGDQVKSVASPFALTFVLSRPTGSRWLIIATLPLR